MDELKRNAAGNLSRFGNWIKEKFHAIGSWLREKFSAAQEKIKAMFSSIGDFLTENIVEPLRSALKNFISWIRGKN